MKWVNQSQGGKTWIIVFSDTNYIADGSKKLLYDEDDTSAKTDIKDIILVQTKQHLVNKVYQRNN